MKSSIYVKRQLFEIRLISVISFVFVAFCQPRILRYSARDVTDIFAIVCYCAHEQKMNFEGFTQNGCYGNKPQPFEVVFYSIDANTSCSFTKQDLTVKQAHSASF